MAGVLRIRSEEYPMTAPTKGAKTKAKAEAVVQFHATLSREVLVEALTRVSAAVASKGTLPVLTNVLIEASDRGLQFTATDLDLSIKTTVAADIEQEGATTIPLKRLLAVAKELPPAPVRLSAVNAFALLDCGRAHYKFLSLPVEHFPSIPNVVFGGESVPASELASIVGRVSFAVSAEESRPILNGVLWERTSTATRLVATNGHRLALVERPAEPSLGKAGSYIVPRKAIDQVPRLFASEDQLAIGLGSNHLALRSDTTTVLTRLIEGPYPNYNEVIPKSGTVTAIVDREAFIHSVKRILPVASKVTYRLRVDFARGMVCLSASTPDVGECSDEFAARLNGPDLSLGVNGDYLIEILSAIDSDEVRITADTPERAITFEPMMDRSDERSLFLLMPLRLLD